jgi:ketopantoate reductase
VPATAVDLALVCVKSYQVDSIASFLGRSLANNNKDAVVVTFCNGIGHLPRLASLLPPRVAILPAVTYMAAERLEAGTVKVHGYGSTYLLGSRGSRRGQPTNLSLNNRHMRQHPEPASFQEITNERGKRPTLGDSVVIRTAEAEHAQQASQELWLQALAEEKKHIPQQEQRPPPGKEPAAAVRSIQWTSPWIVCPELNAVQWHLVNERQGLCAWMNRAGIGPASVGEDTQPFIEKLAINCGINPVATLLRVRNGVLKDLPDALRLAELAAQEVAALFGLPEQAIKQRLRAVLQATSGNVNSMLADMQRGQPTEIDALNGAVASLQAAKGEHLPSVNAVLAALVRAMSQRFQQKHP